MATKIVTKNSSTASAVPTASDLVQGELAVNVADKRLFTEDNGGSIVELGTNPSSLTVSGNIDVDGTTNLDVVDIDGAVDMASTLAVGGIADFADHVDLLDNKELRLGTGNDYKFDYDGSRLNVIGTGDTVFDITGDFYIDADGADIIFQDGGTSFAEHDKDGNNYRIKNPISDGDLIFQGNDGGSPIAALTLDMSQAGRATFNEGIVAKTSTAGAFGLTLNTTSGDNMKLSVTDTGTGGGADGIMSVSDGDLTLDVAGDIILDADGGEVYLKDGGTSYGQIKGSTSDLIVQALVADKDIIFKGTDSDGESVVTALTLDMSAAGRATFNADVIIPRYLEHASDSDTFIGFSADNTFDITVGAVEVAEFTASEVVINEDSADVDFRVESDGNDHMLFVDGGNNRVGIGTSSPNRNLHISGGASDVAFGITNSASGTSASSGFSITVENPTPDVAIRQRENANMKFLTNNSERFRISSDGSLSTPTAGTSNVRFGVNAGNSIASGGNFNTLVGDKAGTAITTGDQNTFVGFQAGDVTTTSSNNTGIGNNALGGNVLGSYNVAIGKDSLEEMNPTSATNMYNTAVGAAAGQKVTTGIRNTLVGGLAGDASTTANYNTALGYTALGDNTTGDFNTAIGDNALARNATATGNTAVGQGSLQLNTTGANNVAVGYTALDANTTASNNTAVGTAALSANTTGASNVAVGKDALDSNTTGSNNVALGVDALQSNTIGAESVAIGTFALNAQNPASATNMYNVAVGHNSGASVTTGIENTLIGGLAGDALQDADYNVAIGSSALTSDTLGSKSVAVGTGTLENQNFASATNSYNTALGFFAGRAVTTGTNNTFVGGLAGDGTDDGANNVAVGYGALSANCASNNTALGHGAGGSVESGGNVLIGTNTGVDTTALTTGANNTLVGAYLRTDAADSDYCMGLGYNMQCAAGYTTLGRDSSDIRASHGNVTWATVSDERYKKDIVDSEAGLSLINALRPRTFKYKTLGELPETFNAFEADSTEVFKNSDTNHGFIAQEVKAAIDADDSIKDGFRLWDDREDGSQEVAEAALIPILVKAIQELTARIETLEG